MSGSSFNLSPSSSQVAAVASSPRYMVDIPEEHSLVADIMPPSTLTAKRLQKSLDLLMVGASFCGSSISGVDISHFFNSHPEAAAVPASEPATLLETQQRVALRIKGLRQSLDLGLMLVGASLRVSSALSSVDVQRYLDGHDAAAVPEPTLLDQLRWMRESLECHLLAVGEPSSFDHNSSASASVIAPLLSHPRWLRESLNLMVAVRASVCSGSTLGDIDTEAFFREHPLAAELLEPNTRLMDQVERMRQSLDLMAAIRASICGSSIGDIDTEAFFRQHPLAAELLEPTLRQSLDLMAVLRDSCCSTLSGIDTSRFLDEHEAAAVPEPATPEGPRATLRARMVPRESLELLTALRASCASTLSGIDTEAFFQQHPLPASVSEPAALGAEPPAAANEWMRRSLELLAALRASICGSLIGDIDDEAFFRAHPLAAEPCGARAEPEDAEDANASCSASAAAVSSSSEASSSLSMALSSSSGSFSWSAPDDSLAEDDVPSCHCCCPPSSSSSAPAMEVEEGKGEEPAAAEEETAAKASERETTAASAAVPAHEKPAEAGSEPSSSRRSRGGKLKRKLRKFLRGVFGSCMVGHSADAL